jgi:heptaprenyl diphosphate synthase
VRNAAADHGSGYGTAETDSPWGKLLPDDKLAADISAGMASVESLLWESVKDEQPFVTETSTHLIGAGGKRLRPFLALVCAQFGQHPLAPPVISGATSCEILHVATLYHDDVMDEAKLRRGAVSANERWNNTVAILTGDFLFAVASKLGSNLGSFVLDVHTVTSRRLVTGQLRESVGWSPNLTHEEHYLKVVSDKTASLFSAACQIGAHVAGAAEEHVKLVGRFAESFGVAFQLSDDLLDIMGDDLLGKKVGADLEAKVSTLPVIYVKSAADPADARLLELLDGDLADAANLAQALELLRMHKSIDRTRLELQKYVDQACLALDLLPQVPATQALRSLAESMITRQM